MTCKQVTGGKTCNTHRIRIILIVHLVIFNNGTLWSKSVGQLLLKFVKISATRIKTKNLQHHCFANYLEELYKIVLYCII